jgi:hypothetical protein
MKSTKVKSKMKQTIERNEIIAKIKHTIKTKTLRPNRINWISIEDNEIRVL